MSFYQEKSAVYRQEAVVRNTAAGAVSAFENTQRSKQKRHGGMATAFSMLTISRAGQLDEKLQRRLTATGLRAPKENSAHQKIGLRQESRQAGPGR